MVFSKRVSVPAFVNPHLFWIFEVENAEKRGRFQERLNRNLQNPRKIEAQRGELVVVFDNKAWRRAEVINVFQENYDCWLIDYGSLCKTNKIYELPGEFTCDPAMVHMACLNNIVEQPAVLDIETGNHVRQDITSFSHSLSTLINTLIFQAETVIFNMQRIIDHVLCGQMQLTHDGVTYNLSDKLLGEKRIAVNPDLFREAFQVNNRGVMQLRNYVICEAQAKVQPFYACEDVGIGRGHTRRVNGKQAGPRSTQVKKSYVQTWIDESNAQLSTDHKSNPRGASTPIARHSPTVTDDFQNRLSPGKFSTKSISSDRMYEDADENAESPRGKSATGSDPSSFQNPETDEKRKKTIEPENDGSRSKSRSNRSLNSIGDDYFETVEDDVNLIKKELSTRELKNKLHDSIDDDFFDDDEEPLDHVDGKSKSRTASSLLKQHNDDDPFSNSEEDSSEQAKKSPLIKRHVDDGVFSDSDEDSSKNSVHRSKADAETKKTNNGDSSRADQKIGGPKENRSSISAKLPPGFKIYPAGVSLSSCRREAATKKRKSEGSGRANQKSTPKINQVNQVKSISADRKSTPKINEPRKERAFSSKSISADEKSTPKTNEPRKERASSSKSISAEQKSTPKTNELRKERASSSKSSASSSNEFASEAKELPQSGASSRSSSSDSECAPQPCRKSALSFGCKCESCRTWNDDDVAGEYNRYKDSRGATKRESARPSLLFRGGDAEDVIDVKTKRSNGRTKIERDMAPTLLVHGFCVPASASKINEVPFNTHVLRALTKLKFRSAKTIQSYTWPALMRHMNVCMVHGSGTGKTMAYLPAICSYVLESSERYPDLPKTAGPVAIILCKGVRKVEETYSLFCNFRAHVGKRINVNWAASPLDNSSLKSVRTSDVLIATPNVLVTLLKRRAITLKRLCHLVLEETDQVLNKFPQEFADLTEVVQSMLKHRSCIYGVQIVLCSEHWTVPLEKFIGRLYSIPLICIGAYLESALYGRVDIRMHFVQSKIKLSMLCDILKEKSHVRKTLIVCNEEDEIDVLEEHLRIKGVSVTSVRSTMKSEEVLEVELMWENTVCGKHAALLCTDALLQAQLSITNANVLVHYSLPPDSWTQFSRRFKCLVDSYESPFNSKSPDKCQVHVFVDEACDKQYPRLYGFLQSTGAKVPEKFSELSKKIKEGKELQKIELQTKLCPASKLFGQCDKTSCKKRHLLSQKDVSATLPQNGSIKFRLTSVDDVSVYTVRLIEHTSTDGKVHKYPDNSDFGRELSRSIKQKQVYARHPELGGLFAWFDGESNAYHRCEIVRVLSEDQITKLPDDVHVKLIDVGGVKKTTASLLFELPQPYEALPALGVEIYLANLIPPDRDAEWSFNMRDAVKKVLAQAEYQKPEAYFTGRIVLQLENTLWLEDVVLQEDLPFSNETVRKLLLKKTLLDRQVVAHSPQQLSRLYAMCETAGVKLRDYKCETPVKATAPCVKQVKPQWAHLDEDNLNPVYFCSGISPHLFYVRLEKFYGLFQKFQKELQNLVNQPHYPVVREVKVGDCYLVRDPGSEEFCRAVVTETRDETVECFFVDFGDGACVFKNEIKHLPDACITRMPFQAVQCKLFGIVPPMEVWPDEATDVLYQYCFEPKSGEGCDAKSDIFRTLYVSTLGVSIDGSGACRNYSVLLVDYYSGKPLLINRILIDCGFALPVEDISIDNIKLPECQDYSDEQDDDVLDIKDDSDFSYNKTNDEEVTEKSPSDCENVWDIEMEDTEEFLKDFMGIKKRKNEKSTEKIRMSEAPSEAYPHIRALPPAKHHTPDLAWHQTDRHVKIDIKMPNVTEYSLHILRKRIFIFSTMSGGKEYKLHFQLYEDVEKGFQHSSGGLVVRVTLEKCSSVEWPRLTKSEQKFRHIKYDVSKCDFPEEEKKRLFLEIDRNGKEDDDDSDGNYFVFGSDEDCSEFDIESKSSED